MAHIYHDRVQVYRHDAVQLGGYVVGSLILRRERLPYLAVARIGRAGCEISVEQLKSELFNLLNLVLGLVIIFFLTS